MIEAKKILLSGYGVDVFQIFMNQNDSWQLFITADHFFTFLLCCSVSSDSLRPFGLQPTRPLCPWYSPGKNTGGGCHFLLQGIFPTQGSNLCLPPYRQTLYRLSHQGSIWQKKQLDSQNTYFKIHYYCQFRNLLNLIFQMNQSWNLFAVTFHRLSEFYSHLCITKYTVFSNTPEYQH